ncbi:MAG TPA: zinc ABC transporter substrate-binding protein, partial [Acidimicrobiaceae bacterium]|nr:zinc ABC transporter substrate-binding protein [Acidimicrobiaceae bacterium]
HADHADHAHDGVDPHFFTDPARMAVAVKAISDFLIATIEGIDIAVLRSNTNAYVGKLEALDAEIAAMVEGVPEERRVLVTNHQVFGYFADRYGFEVVGTIIPTGSTADGASAQQLTKLSKTIKEEKVPAIFADTSSSDQLAQTLAAETGQIQVVKLYSESLGNEDSDGSDYLEMVRTNATRITTALGG